MNARQQALRDKGLCVCCGDKSKGHDTLGATLKSLRQAKGYTTQQVADALFCNRPYLSQIENDRQSPSFKKVEALVNFYGYEIALIHRSHPACRRRR